MTSKSTDAVTVKKVEIDSDDSFNKMIGFHFSYSLFYLSPFDILYGYQF